MAERRMYSKKITDSDAFVEMAASAQALYFHLNQGADDDGFNNQIQNAMFKAHASVDDLKVLLAKNFIIRFESGVVVIKHWLIHNTLRKDRYTPTNFQEELKLLGIKDNKVYTLNHSETAWLPNGCQTVTTGKERLDKNSIGKDIDSPPIIPPKGEPTQKERESVQLEKIAGNLFERFRFSERIKGAINIWLQYKKERHETYKESGLKILLNRINNAIKENGEEFVVKQIEQSISSNYQGLFFDKANYKANPAKPRTSVHFGNERKYTKEDFEKLYTDVDDLDI